MTPAVAVLLGAGIGGLVWFFTSKKERGWDRYDDQLSGRDGGGGVTSAGDERELPGDFGDGDGGLSSQERQRGPLDQYGVGPGSRRVPEYQQRAERRGPDLKGRLTAQERPASYYQYAVTPPWPRANDAEGWARLATTNRPVKNAMVSWDRGPLFVAPELKGVLYPTWVQLTGDEQRLLIAAAQAKERQVVGIGLSDQDVLPVSGTALARSKADPDWRAAIDVVASVRQYLDRVRGNVGAPARALTAEAVVRMLWDEIRRSYPVLPPYDNLPAPVKQRLVQRAERQIAAGQPLTSDSVQDIVADLLRDSVGGVPELPKVKISVPGF